MSWRAVAAVVLLIAGGSIELLAVLGLCAMRDVYDRVHYVGLSGIGGLLIGVAIVVRESFSLIGNKTLLIAFFLIVSGPVLVHATARAARIRESGEWSIKEGERVKVVER